MPTQNRLNMRDSAAGRFRCPLPYHVDRREGAESGNGDGGDPTPWYAVCPTDQLIPREIAQCKQGTKGNGNKPCNQSDKSGLGKNSVSIVAYMQEFAKLSSCLLPPDLGYNLFFFDTVAQTCSSWLAGGTP